jgi:hypothetical protein
MGIKIKYNRTFTVNQNVERFKLDKEVYDLTLFDKGVSGKEYCRCSQQSLMVGRKGNECGGERNG